MGALGYELIHGGVPTSRSVQATIEGLASSVEDTPDALQVGRGGLTLSREEGEGDPTVLRVGFFDVFLERLERDGKVLLTKLEVRQPGGEYS